MIFLAETIALIALATLHNIHLRDSCTPAQKPSGYVAGKGCKQSSIIAGPSY